MTVRTRFAPSPTGLLHVGNARAALFNFLFARHHGGRFLLRIEDTDRERSTQRAVDVILDGLDWMGLNPDETPVYQSTRQARHAEVALALLEAGRAYRCYCTQDELRQMREQAATEGRPPRYNGMWRDRDPAEAPAGAPFTVRLRAPQDRRDGRARPGAGRDTGRQRRDGRHDHPARRRHADLPARGGV